MSLTSASPLEAAEAAKSASHILAALPTSARNDALTAIHAGLSEARDEILAANARDLEVARLAAEHGQLSQSLVARLDLGKKGKWEDMLKGILDVRDLEDPGESPSYRGCTALTSRQSWQGNATDEAGRWTRSDESHLPNRRTSDHL